MPGILWTVSQDVLFWSVLDPSSLIRCLSQRFLVWRCWWFFRQLPRKIFRNTCWEGSVTMICPFPFSLAGWCPHFHIHIFRRCMVHLATTLENSSCCNIRDKSTLFSTQLFFYSAFCRARGYACDLFNPWLFFVGFPGTSLMYNEVQVFLYLHYALFDNHRHASLDDATAAPHFLNNLSRFAFIF